MPSLIHKPRLEVLLHIAALFHIILSENLHHTSNREIHTLVPNTLTITLKKFRKYL